MPFVPTSLLPTMPALSGDLIVRMNPPLEDWLGYLQQLLSDFPGLVIRRLLRSTPWADVRALEVLAAGSEFPPMQSLNAYWRVETRGRSLAAIEQARLALEGQRWVERVYAEYAVFPASDPTQEPEFNDQDHHTTLHSQAAWSHGARGQKARLDVVELGWNDAHEELVALKLGPPLAGDNAGAGHTLHARWCRNHGTSAIAAAAARANNAGGAGVAPDARVRIASCFEAATNIQEHVADAIIACLDHKKGARVLLLEVQRSFMPTEVDEADFHAIRLATALGVTVIEPAGNGALDLDHLSLPGGQTVTARWSWDSGAVVVASSSAPNVALADTNHGARVDCHAPGVGIHTAGVRWSEVGTADPPGLNTQSRPDFGRTSAAAALAAGAAACLVGSANPLPSPWLVREWFRGTIGPVAGTTPGIGAAVDLTRWVPSLVPPSYPSVAVAPTHYAVSSPQTGSGETNVIDPMTGDEKAVILTPAVGGYPLGTTSIFPPAGVTFTEHLVFRDADAALNVGTRWAWVDQAGSPDPNYGVWLGAVTLATFGAHWNLPAVRHAETTFTYQLLSTVNIGAQKGLPAATLAAYTLRQNGQVVGQLRRWRAGATQNDVKDLWVLGPTYRTPGPNLAVSFERIPGPLNSTSDWLLAENTPGNTKIFVSSVYTIS